MSEPTARKVHLYTDPLFLRHDAGPGHVERPERLIAIEKSLAESPIPGLERCSPTEATAEEILRVHTREHFEEIRATEGKERVVLDPDTSTGPESYQVALRAAGAVNSCVRDIVSGEADGALALVRPPGHHAESDQAMGFCLFANVAIAAEVALQELGLERVLILDPDVHHGNGTQHIFEDRSDVLFVSSHRYPLYPGTGWFDEVGRGQGAGYTVNLPMPALLGDEDFLFLYRTVVEPIVDQFQPQLILVSAGFDTWKDDPLGMMKMTRQGYDQLFSLFRSWADRHCGGRIVAALEGGYDPAGVVQGVRACLRAWTAEEVETPDTAALEAAVGEKVLAIAQAAREHLNAHWTFAASSQGQD